MPVPALVGSNGVSTGPVTITSFACAFSPANTGGNTGVAMVVPNSPSTVPSITSFTDTQGNTWQLIASATVAPSQAYKKGTSTNLILNHIARWQIGLKVIRGSESEEILGDIARAQRGEKIQSMEEAIV